MKQPAKREFFNKLAVEMGLLNPEDAKKYYYAFVRLLIRTTKQEGFCEAPDLGKFEIRVFTGKRRRNLHGLKGSVTAEVVRGDPLRVIKWIADYKIKTFINN